MYFECDECGKNTVRRPGDMCGECQKRYYIDDQIDEAEWFAKSSLCQQCGNASGCDASDLCDHYKMPLYMVARKKKCKHFKELIDPEFEWNEVW